MLEKSLEQAKKHIEEKDETGADFGEKTEEDPEKQSQMLENELMRVRGQLDKSHTVSCYSYPVLKNPDKPNSPLHKEIVNLKWEFQVIHYNGDYCVKYRGFRKYRIVWDWAFCPLLHEIRNFRLF